MSGVLLDKRDRPYSSRVRCATDRFLDRLGASPAQAQPGMPPDTGGREGIVARIGNGGWNSFAASRGPQVLDRTGAARIDWDEDTAAERAVAP